MSKLIHINDTTRRIGRYTADFLERFSERPMTVNLGVGTPTLAADYLRREDIYLHAENGLLGLGPLAEENNIDADLVNASMEPSTAMPGCSYFDICNSFCMIRGGHIDVVVLGGYEVSRDGSLANYALPGKTMGVGGAMDLACCARTLVVSMSQTSKGRPKLVEQCKLPVTAIRAVDYVITERGIFHFFDGAVTLEAMAEDTSPEQIRSEMEFDFALAPDLRILTT